MFSKQHISNEILSTLQNGPKQTWTKERVRTCRDCPTLAPMRPQDLVLSKHVQWLQASLPGLGRSSFFTLSLSPTGTTHWPPPPPSCQDCQPGFSPGPGWELPAPGQSPRDELASRAAGLGLLESTKLEREGSVTTTSPEKWPFMPQHLAVYNLSFNSAVFKKLKMWA